MLTNAALVVGVVARVDYGRRLQLGQLAITIAELIQVRRENAGEMLDGLLQQITELFTGGHI